MSGSDNEFHDDWFDGLTDAEYAELRRITTPQERKIILACAQRYDDVKCDNNKNHAKHRFPSENHENHENQRIPCENNKNLGNLRIPTRITKVMKIK